jgi:hypothetical protein
MIDMAKSQKRSNREIRKPKASKSKPSVVPIPAGITPLVPITYKLKGKL